MDQKKSCGALVDGTIYPVHRPDFWSQSDHFGSPVGGCQKGWCFCTLPRAQRPEFNGFNDALRLAWGAVLRGRLSKTNIPAISAISGNFPGSGGAAEAPPIETASVGEVRSDGRILIGILEEDAEEGQRSVESYPISLVARLRCQRLHLLGNLTKTTNLRK